MIFIESDRDALYEVLKNAKADLVEALEPTLFKEGKGIENADIYDLLELLISKGEPSEPTSAVIDMLPALREKEEAYKVYTTQEGEFYVHKRNNRNTSNDILNTSSHWDNMVSHRDNKMQDKYSIDTEGESTSRGEVEEFRGVGNKATYPQRTKEIREKNKGIARELKDIQKKTD